MGRENFSSQPVPTVPPVPVDHGGYTPASYAAVDGRRLAVVDVEGYSLKER